MVHESLQALVILTLIILSTPGNTLEGNAKVWEEEEAAPFGMRPFISARALETDESALSPQTEDSIVRVSTLGFITLHQA